jgi:hypothetical protein
MDYICKGRGYDSRRLYLVSGIWNRGGIVEHRMRYRLAVIHLFGLRILIRQTTRRMTPEILRVGRAKMTLAWWASED